MSNDIEQRLKAIRSRVEASAAERSNAETQLAVAADRVSQARAALKASFGVGTAEEAGALIVQLESSLAAAVSEAEALLGEAERE